MTIADASIRNEARTNAAASADRTTARDTITSAALSQVDRRVSDAAQSTATRRDGVSLTTSQRGTAIGDNGNRAGQGQPSR